MTTDKKFEKFEKLNKRAEESGGKAKIDKQHQLGKFTARERINFLLDEGTFEEFDKFVTHRCNDFEMEKQIYLGDGVVTGYGYIDGRPVYVFANDFTVFGGSLSEAFGEKICKIMDLAMKNGCPVIGLNDSGGARIQEGVVSLAAYAEIFLRNTLASGVVPQISAIMGPCAGGAVYSPAITDFTIMVKESSYMFITGPEVIKTVTHEEVTPEQLGGAMTHATRSGVAHFAAEDEDHSFEIIRELLSFIPQNNLEDPPFKDTDDPIDRQDEELNNIIPANPNKPYDIRDIITRVADDTYFFEVQPHYAQNIIIGYMRLGGKSVGVIANQPAVLAGCLDIDASIKAARFVRFCDAFNIPLVVFEDVPGFLPGINQEYGGIIKHGAKLLYAFSEATVPKITVVTRKAYGGAYCVMNSKQIRADLNLAYLSAELAVMGPEGAVNIIYRKELLKSDNPEEFRIQKVDEYRKLFTSPYVAAQRGYIDQIIEPKQTRPKLIKALLLLENKRDKNPPKKHGNIPL